MTEDELAEFIVAEVRMYVDTTLLRTIERLEAAFAERVELAVEERIKALPAPEPGQPGKDADPVMVGQLVMEAVSKFSLPEDGKDGKDGEPGRDGKDADPEIIRAEVAKAVAALPVPKDGRDGEKGKDVDLLVVKALVAGEVAHAVAAMPPPKDGRDGKDGITEQQLNDGIVKGLKASWGEVHLDRRDFKIGDHLLATIPFVLYADVYQPEKRYEKGDMVTWGGDGWHCNEPTTDKPGTSGAWTLAIKKGRDFRPRERDVVPPGPVKR